jgi:hypothetical protein
MKREKQLKRNIQTTANIMERLPALLNLETKTEQDSRASSIQPGTSGGESGIVFAEANPRQSAERRL